MGTPKVTVGLQTQIFSRGQGSISGQPRPSLGPEKVAPDRLGRITPGHRLLELLLGRGQLEDFNALVIGETIHSGQTRSVGVIERSLEYRSVKGLVDEPVRRIVVKVALLKRAAHHTVGVKGPHHLRKWHSKFRQMIANVAISGMVEVAPIDRNSQTVGHRIGLRDAGRRIVGPTNSDHGTGLGEALDPCAYRDLVIRMRHAEEPSE